MGNRAEYYRQADFCKRMAEKAALQESRERWLDLTAKWLALADGTYGQSVVDLVTVRSGK